MSQPIAPRRTYIQIPEPTECDFGDGSGCSVKEACDDPHAWDPQRGWGRDWSWRERVLRRSHRWGCTSPRRNHCRVGTSRRGRDQDPAVWGCSGKRHRGADLFLGPLAAEPISDSIWYERPVTWLWLDGRR